MRGHPHILVVASYPESPDVVTDYKELEQTAIASRDELKFGIDLDVSNKLPTIRVRYEIAAYMYVPGVVEFLGSELLISPQIATLRIHMVQKKMFKQTFWDWANVYVCDYSRRSSSFCWMTACSSLRNATL
jgi:hypothetical protein